MSAPDRTTFHPALIRPGKIQLRVNTAGQAGNITAYLRGVPVGAPVAIDPSLPLAEIIVDRLPNVKLPAEIRLAWDDGTEACDPVIIRTQSDALNLAGHGELSDVTVSFTQGQVRGTARNGKNGVETPLIIGRLNGALLRQVNVSLAGPHEAGGAMVAFDMPVDANDFAAEGGVIELLHAPAMNVIWRHALGPVGDTHAEAVKMLRQASTLEHTLRGAVAEVENRLSHKIAKQNQLLEDITTYMLALIHDRANAKDGAAPDRDMARTLIAKAQGKDAAQSDQNLSVVGPLSPFIGQGWSSPKLSTDRIEVRQFTTAATVLNPQPNRAVKKIVITAVEASPELLSGLTVLLDGEPHGFDTLGLLAAPCSLVIQPSTPISVGLVTLSSRLTRESARIQDVRFQYTDDL